VMRRIPKSLKANLLHEGIGRYVGISRRDGGGAEHTIVAGTGHSGAAIGRRPTLKYHRNSRVEWCIITSWRNAREKCFDFPRTRGFKAVRLCAPHIRIDDFAPGEHDTPDRLMIPEKLYGRDREVATLLAACPAARLVCLRQVRPIQVHHSRASSFRQAL
jgi:hypothetical protein